MHGVRTTLRALHDLGLKFPPLTQSLSEIDHVVVKKSQDVPVLHGSGSAERIRAITDRSFFKVKVDDWRAAAALIVAPVSGSRQIDAAGASSTWWTVAAGHRKGDTPKQDFYERLAEECRRAAKDTAAKVSSDALLPKCIDYERLVAEHAAIAIENIKGIVRQAICRSAQTGDAWTREIAQHKITALVQTTDGDTYLAIVAEGFLDPKILAVILDAVPNVPKEFWAAEPGEVLGIRPQHDQSVFSTILPAEVLAQLLEEHDENHL